MPTSKSEYIVTASQSYISRSANILVAPNLHSKGKSVIQKNVTVHGEFGAPIHIGRYVYIDEDVEIVPSVIPRSSDPLMAISNTDRSATGMLLPPTENETAIPVIIGSHTKIGNNCTIQSISIGSCVRIGSNCRISPRSKIHDCCIIENDTVIPPDMVIPPFSRVRGNPARIVGTLPECSGGEFVEDCVQKYTGFVRDLGE
ncbi:hypothetical protein ACHAXM_010150 [Skeletonema potamos]|jgi:dynactin-5